MRPTDYIRSLNNRGIWCFTFQEAQMSLGKNTTAALRNLRKQKRIVNPARGFYVIIPEEMSFTGRIPVERFIDDLMQFYRVPYYIGLLTAASFYGSAQQSPQVFQVMTYPSRRSIQFGHNKIAFYRKKNVGSVPTNKRKTQTGYVRISTVETTFFDLIQFNRIIGGLDYVALLTSELTEQMTIAGLKEAIPAFQMPIIQRGGYLLEFIGFEKGAAVIEKWIKTRNPIYTYLNPSLLQSREPKHRRWKLIINEKIDYSG
jgi:predicted transcriptional regulator of viral defense system